LFYIDAYDCPYEEPYWGDCQDANVTLGALAVNDLDTACSATSPCTGTHAPYPGHMQTGSSAAGEWWIETWPVGGTYTNLTGATVTLCTDTLATPTPTPTSTPTRTPTRTPSPTWTPNPTLITRATQTAAAGGATATVVAAATQTAAAWTRTPTVTPTPPALIEEIFAHQAATPVNYNLRSGAGGNDHFIELYSSRAQVMADASLVITPCQVTLPQDSVILAGGRLVVWADELVDQATRLQCAALPITGTLELRDPAGAALQVVTYPDVGAGLAALCPAVSGACTGTGTPSRGR